MTPIATGKTQSTGNDTFPNLVQDSIIRLDRWIEHNGWSGWDPFDIRGTVWYISLVRKKTRLSQLLLRVVSNLEVLAPRFLRALFRLQPRVNPKAMGLFLQAYTNLFVATGEQRYLDKAWECAEWLLENPSTGYSGLCWGYPFDWQAYEVFIPRHTPSSVVTATVGDGFWRLFNATNEKKYLDACVSICGFLKDDLSITFEQDDAVCLSYTPVDRFQVHNANLFAAEFLTRVGKEVNDSSLVSLGTSAGRFALKEQNEDGSLYYWGREQNHRAPDHLDIYHSGFEIRGLMGLWKNTGLDEFRTAFTSYLDFFTAAYFTPKGHPRYSPAAVFPIDIHGCAEAIVTLAATLQGDHEKKTSGAGHATEAPGIEYDRNRALLEQATRWVLDTMQTRDGWFIYRIVKKPYGVVKIRIPLIRWGQAWMLKALSEIVSL